MEYEIIMGMIKEYAFHDWEEFKSLFAERLQQHTDNPTTPLRRGQFLFRGMEDSDWHLDTSFSRKFGCLSSSNTAGDLLHNFKKACESNRDLKEIMNDDHEMLALGQHYGLTSYLLDWAESPYIAAFFAFHFALTNLAKTPKCEIVSERKNIAIWALDRKDKDFWSIESEPRKIKIIRANPIYNKRLDRQFGWFTVLSDIKEPLDQYIQCIEPEKIALWKFLIPLREVVDAMADLSLMGIDANQMYGGVEGSALGALDNTILKLIISKSI